MPNKFVSVTFILFICFIISDANADANGYGKVLVKVANVQVTDLFDKFSAIGQCKNNESRSYYASIAGTIDFISMKQGDKVKAGDVIVAIDRKLAESTKSHSEAVFNKAQLNYTKDQSLFSKKIISDYTLMQSKIDLENAERELATSIKTYNDMVITAPFNGEVGVVRARIGDDVKQGDYLFSLVANGSKSIFLELPESLYGKISISTPVTIVDDENKVPGKVNSVSQYISDNGTVTIKIIIEGTNSLIHGSYVNAELIVNEHKGRAIPERTVLKNDKGNFVYKIDKDNIVSQEYVTLGTRTNNLIEILSDNLKEGDTIILEGLTKIQEGSVVEILQ